MKPRYGWIALVIVLGIIGFRAFCDRHVGDYPRPATAHQLAPGIYGLTLKPGNGKEGAATTVHGLETKLISHSLCRCSYPCEDYQFGRRQDFGAQWQVIVMSMKAGETKRVWIDDGSWRETRVYDVILMTADD